MLVDPLFIYLFFIFLALFLLFPFVTEKDVKIPQKMISTSKRQVKHPFAGQNTLQGVIFLDQIGLTSFMNVAFPNQFYLQLEKLFTIEK